MNFVVDAEKQRGFHFLGSSLPWQLGLSFSVLPHTHTPIERLTIKGFSWIVEKSQSDMIYKTFIHIPGNGLTSSIIVPICLR